MIKRKREHCYITHPVSELILVWTCIEATSRLTVMSDQAEDAHTVRHNTSNNKNNELLRPQIYVTFRD